MKASLGKFVCLMICASLLPFCSGCGGCTGVNKVAAVLQDGIDTFAPGEWEIALIGILSKLDEIGTDLATQVSKQVQVLMESARQQMELYSAFAENAAFCTVDFVGSRVELRLKGIANSFFPNRFPRPDYHPAICNVIPHEITSNYSGNVMYYGYDFKTFQGEFAVNIQEQNGPIVANQIAEFLPQSNYQGSVQIVPHDMARLDPAKKYKVVLQWLKSSPDNPAHATPESSEISILWSTPTPIPTLPAPETTERFSEEDPGQNCRSGFVVQGIECFGDYCDDLKLTCAPYMSGRDETLNTRWQAYERWISEEKGRNDFLFTQGFIWGMTCRGSYCDDMKPTLMSSNYIENTGDCRPTPRFSEERRSPMICQPGYYVAGFSCEDDYCDYIELTCCRANIKWP